jgi:hypothetical protein
MIMLFRLVALLLITSTFAAQTPTIPPSQSNSTGNLIPQSGGTIAVPQGSVVALKLISTIKSKSSHPGDPVRAAVAFPLAIDTRVAIPAGTYVEGVVDKINAHPARGAAPSVQLRFTRLLFSNGYSVPLVAINAEATAPIPNDPRRTRTALADARDGAPYLGEAFSGQNPTQPPPLPSLGPSPGTLAGIGIGTGVGILVLGLVIGHHRATSTDYVLFDSGWQFQMALQEPLALDAAQVTAAAAIAR